jgi:membrane fusion protein (multidrug efflux system)
VVAAERRAITQTSEFVGRIEAVDRVELRARVTGFLQERAFREGDDVRAGTVLFRLERAPFEAEVARQEANVAAAEAELANAAVQLARARQLLATNAGTQARVDDATAQQRAAQAQVLAAQASLRTARINLDYTVITAPVDGRVGRAAITPGNVVGPDRGVLATLISQDPMHVTFAVSVRVATELRNRYESQGGTAGVVVRLRLPDGSTYDQAGRLEFVGTQVDRNTDTILLRATIPNPVRPQRMAGDVGDRELVDGMFVSVILEGIEPVQATVIPRQAVLQDQQGAYVFVVDAQGRAQQRRIRLGQSTPQQAAIEDGLQPGENVIVEGIQRVRPGQPVQAGPVSAAPRS